LKQTPPTNPDASRLRELLASIPYAQLLGIELAGVEHGAATLLLHVRDELMRMEGIMHGGALASLIDTASAFAVLTTLEPEQRTVTVDLTVHYLRPVTHASSVPDAASSPSPSTYTTPTTS
jgi:acyl-CoA thioesterase